MAPSLNDPPLFQGYLEAGEGAGTPVREHRGACRHPLHNSGRQRRPSSSLKGQGMRVYALVKRRPKGRSVRIGVKPRIRDKLADPTNGRRTLTEDDQSNTICLS